MYELYPYQIELINRMKMSTTHTIEDVEDRGRGITVTGRNVGTTAITLPCISQIPKVNVVDSEPGKFVLESPFGVDIEKMTDHHIIRAREKLEVWKDDFDKEGLRCVKDKSKRRKQAKSAKQARKNNRTRK